jgi:hypothetical protein
LGGVLATTEINNDASLFFLSSSSLVELSSEKRERRSVKIKGPRSLSPSVLWCACTTTVLLCRRPNSDEPTNRRRVLVFGENDGTITVSVSYVCMA